MITYTSLERKQYGMMTRPDGTDAPLFHYVAGPELTSEVWAPGPLAGTVWVLDSTADRGARVVNVKHSREVEYSTPALPAPCEVSADDARRADEILTQLHASEVRRDWRGMENYNRPAAPSTDDVDWARALHAQLAAYRSAVDFMRAGHGAPKPISDKRFRELAMPDVRVEDTQLLLAS